MVNVIIPSPLYSYTSGAKSVDVAGASVSEAIKDLDRRYPGLKFRIVDEQEQIRTHIRVFVNDEIATLATPLREGDEMAIVAALSGG